jgi:hypothetical protein
MAGRSVHGVARAGASEAACADCGTVPRRVHSCYQRLVSDTASGCQEVVIHLQARRFMCGSHECAKATFAQQVSGWPRHPVRPAD